MTNLSVNPSPKPTWDGNTETLRWPLDLTTANVEIVTSEADGTTHVFRCTLRFPAPDAACITEVTEVQPGWPLSSPQAPSRFFLDLHGEMVAGATGDVYTIEESGGASS